VRAGHPALQGWKLRLAAPAWRLFVLSVPVRPKPAVRPAHPGPVIYACLHRDLIPAILYVRPTRPVLLVSQSADGEVLISALRPHGFGFARGSTGRGGGSAFVRLLTALREGRSVGVAVDGPRGPFGAVGEGVVQLSRLSGRPVVPLRARPRHCWRLRTWDGTIVPWPAAVAQVDEGPPLQVPAEADPAEAQSWSARIAAALTEAR
jgi:lysophospholipid acyltransferase (LPLAT)-like uncharacterized protein